MSTPVTSLPGRVSLNEYRAACSALIETMTQASILKRRRPLEKLEAIVRLMTRKDLPPGGQPWAWTRAEDLARLDGEYDEFKSQCEEADREIEAAKLRVEAARLELQLLIGSLGAL